MRFSEVAEPENDGVIARGIARVLYVPVRDPVDQRSAAALQLLALFGLLYPLVATAVAWPQGCRPAWFEVGTIIANTIITLSSLVLVRRGRLVAGARLFVFAGSVLVLVSQGRWGLGAQVSLQLTQLLPLLVGGLFLGRRALWWAVVGMIAAVLVGALRDASQMAHVPGAMPGIIGLATRVGLGVLLVGTVLDYSILTLRESVRAARRRGSALLQARNRIQLEIQEKERSREQFLHAQRAVVVGNLAAGIAHDLNHLLGLILAYTARRRRSVDVEQLQSSLEGIEAAAARAAEVSRRLLDFSRHEESNPEYVDVAQMMREMAPLFEQLFDPAVVVKFELPSAVPLVWFDRAQLELIVLGIAANAGDAMPEGGEFRVAVRVFGPAVEMEFEDSGTGMSEEVRARCLEPFFTTKPRGEGTGLGLAVAHNLVTAAGGEILVDSYSGHGTTIRIRLVS